MDHETFLVCSTFPEIETACRIARQLVTENLAACANIIPAVESIYRWQDKIENSSFSKRPPTATARFKRN